MATTNQEPRSPRADGQMTGLSGELFVAAELLKRQLQTSFTLGNAKAIDLFAYNPETGNVFTIQVKSLRRRNYFLIDPEKVKKEHTYVFVLLNGVEDQVEYFVVPGKDLLGKRKKFGNYFTDCPMPGIHPRVLTDAGYRNAWEHFAN